MTVDLSKEDLVFMEMLLAKEEGDTRVEVHHCRDHEYKDYLKARERHVGKLLDLVKGALSAAG